MIPRRRTWYVKQRGTRWCVIRQDGLYADSLHEHKDEAIARGLELSQRYRGRLRVKAQDGRIELECDFHCEN
ncbi:MAG TPA: DUF2188 domain-containing protein [Microbacteriaceae bacterium]|jgi:hypothetical protein|nr:DUF2188 domain-containing protein [Microbacteriaceae bacterium]